MPIKNPASPTAPKSLRRLNWIACDERSVAESLAIAPLYPARLELATNGPVAEACRRQDLPSDGLAFMHMMHIGRSSLFTATDDRSPVPENAKQSREALIRGQ